MKDVENCETVRAFQRFEFRGPRLNKNSSHKKGVHYGPDKRFEVKVFKNLPRINLQLANPLPNTMLAEEVFKIILVARNDGNSPAKNCWINHNMGKHISLAKNETFSADETEISLSSLPNLIKMSGRCFKHDKKNKNKTFLDIDSGEERKIELLFKCPESAGTNNIDLIFYCEDESEKATGQCCGLNLEHQIVGDIRRKVTVLPAPLQSSERVLQGKYPSL